MTTTQREIHRPITEYMRPPGSIGMCSRRTQPRPPRPRAGQPRGHPDQVTVQHVVASCVLRSCGVTSPPMATLPALELRCFGPPTALVDGKIAPPVVLWRKHMALLVYLALSPNHARTREHLRGLFW